MTIIQWNWNRLFKNDPATALQWHDTVRHFQRSCSNDRAMHSPSLPRFLPFLQIRVRPVRDSEMDFKRRLERGT